MSITIKKALVPFPIIIDTEPDRNLGDGIVVTYVEAGTQNTPTQVAGDFVNAGVPGSYENQATINKAGNYKLNVKIPADDKYKEVNRTLTIQIMNASIDDIYNAVKVNESKLDTLQETVDQLDIETLNNLDEMATQIENKLTTLSTMLLDENDPALTSLKELLNMIKESGDANSSLLSQIDSYIKAATDDLEKMIRGDELLTNGNPNPFYGKTNAHIFDALTAMNTFITDTVNAAELAVSNKVEAARSELKTISDEIKSLVENNKAQLEHDVHGLAAIMTAVQTADSESKTGQSNLASDIQNVHTAVQSLSTSVHNKLDTIKSGVDDIKTSLSESTTTIVHA